MGILTVGQAAEFLQVHEDGVGPMIARGDIPIGGFTMYPLRKHQEKTFRDAVTGGPYDHKEFHKVLSVLRIGMSSAPPGVKLEAWPSHISE